ncbi:PAS domain S-box protein [Gilvimarinus algae]|uniref:histidine kinase n=1 Tax=Gilvimarinus algae TaxID=3058037 RepID=A0ABT8THY7_9GAMM|nr:PAS domain S-box protein [Gilvimarinus sp. SDUM040014]MDO3383640.1 PAS domain S-box protein [Gilvimarinus sp. SDUM040014]
MDAQWLGFLSQDYMPHGHCYLWRPSILWTHVASDVAIAAAYFSIPAALLYIRRKRADLLYPSLFTLFSLFILLCGLTHLYSIYTIWVGSYGVHGVIKAGTAVISVATAVVLAYSLPRIVATPSFEQLRRAVESANREKLDRLALQAQYENERNLRDAANASPVGLMVVGQNGEITMANDALCELFGYAEGELTGQNIEVLIQGSIKTSHRQLVDQFFQSASWSRAMAEGRVVQGVHKSGTRIPVEIKLNKKMLDDHLRVFVAVTDMSEKLASQKRLSEANNRFERITGATRDGLWEWDLSSNKLWWSPTLWQLFGYSQPPADVNMNLWEAHIHEADRALFFAALDRHIVGSEPFDIEFRGLQVDRSVRWFRAHGESVGQRGTAHHYMCGSLEDIQHRKDLANSLEEKNQFLESIFSGTSYGVFVLDCLRDGKQVFAAANPAIEEALGCRESDLLGKTILDLAPGMMPNEDAQVIDRRYKRCFDTGKPLTYVENVELKGQSTWWKTALYPLMNSVGNIYRIIGSSTEITDLKDAEKKLSESESFLKSVVDMSLCGLYIYDFEKQANVFINDRYTAITGYDKDDFASMQSMENLFHPDDWEKVTEHMTKVAAMEDQGVLPLEYRFRHKQGHWIWCFSYDSVFTWNNKGSPTQMLGSFIDISEMKRYSEQLQESNINLERFAYLASHDLQEPLRKIVSFATQLEHNPSAASLDEEASYAVSRMAESARRMKQLVQDILQLSRAASSSLQRDTVMLSVLIEGIKEELSELLADNQAQVELEQDGPLSVDAGLFGQLLKNLIENAIKYHRDGVSPHVSLAVEYNENSGSGRTARVTVQDNGIGFSQEYAEKIFLAFHRLNSRDRYPGNGIGLAICEKIAKAHEGEIYAESEPGKGARFTIELPQ